MTKRDSARVNSLETHPTSLRPSISVGCQGWNYDDWTTRAGGASVFYPHNTRADQMLYAYAQIFDTVEVDSTFYAVPSESVVISWAKRTPDAFTFSLKLPQEITHTHALRPSATPTLLEFCERAQLFDDKLGVVLIQLPPQFIRTPENFRALEKFLPDLPQDMHFAIEFRSRDWFDESRVETNLLKLLEAHKVAPALVEGEWIERDVMRRLTDDYKFNFAYVRWMGARDLTRFDTVQRPQEANLYWWNLLIEDLQKRGVSVYAYFSNYYEGHAPASANKLKKLCGEEVIEPKVMETQPSLF